MEAQQIVYSSNNLKGLRVLHLTLDKKYFLQILKGVKKLEYRELKPYWFERLCEKVDLEKEQAANIIDKKDGQGYVYKRFDIIEFKNGYGKNAPVILAVWGGIDLDKPNPEWCDEDKIPLNEKGEFTVAFAIKIGQIIHVKA